MWSKCVDANFHMTFAICVSYDKYFAPPMLILPVKRLNRSVIECCNIEGAIITTSPKGFLNSTLILGWLELFANSFTGSVLHPLVLV